MKTVDKRRMCPNCRGIYHNQRPGVPLLRGAARPQGGGPAGRADCQCAGSTGQSLKRCLHRDQRSAVIAMTVMNMKVEDWHIGSDFSPGHRRVIWGEDSGADRRPLAPVVAADYGGLPPRRHSAYRDELLGAVRSGQRSGAVLRTSRMIVTYIVTTITGFYASYLFSAAPIAGSFCGVIRPHRRNAGDWPARA